MERPAGPSRNAIERIRLERDRHVAFAFAAADLLVETDGDGIIRAASGAAQAVLAATVQELIGRNLSAFVALHDQPLVRRLLQRVRDFGRIDPAAIDLLRADGPRTRALLGACRLPSWEGSVFISVTLLPGGLIASAPPRDQTTGLLTHEALQQAAQRAAGDAENGQALKLLRLDGLSGAIRQLSPDRSAMLMQEIGAALRASSLGGDAAGRLAEDMFGIVAKPLAHADSDAHLAADLRAAFRHFGVPEGQVVSRMASIDLSLGSLSGKDAGRALTYAMNSFVSSLGKDFSITSLHTGLSAAIGEAVSRFADTRAVIVEEKFRLVFQPVVSLPARTVHHFEALSRFPDRPDTFEMVGFMENVGLVSELDLAVCRQAIQHLERTPGIRLAINLSGRSVQNEAFRATLRTIVEPVVTLRDRLLFELTESAAVEQLEQAASFLGWLRQLGHKVCLDDFGAGAAAYSYLRRFDVDYVKIDGPFMQAAVDNPRERALIRSICRLCKEIGCEVIGEMIEDERTAAAAAELGVGYGQGWLFGRPTHDLPRPVAARRRKGTVDTWE